MPSRSPLPTPRIQPARERQTTLRLSLTKPANPRPGTGGGSETSRSRTPLSRPLPARQSGAGVSAALSTAVGHVGISPSRQPGCFLFLEIAHVLLRRYLRDSTRILGTRGAPGL